MDGSHGTKSPPFEFPSNRFPCFNPVSREVQNLHAEQFPPPLSFNPRSPIYIRSGIKYVRFLHQFFPQGEELRTNKMEVLYNVVDDLYTRPQCGASGQNLDLSSWEEGTWAYCNIERKLEGGWKMGYLAKQDANVDNLGNPLDAFLEYRFNLRYARKKVRSLRLRLPSTTYRDGKVRVLVCSSDDHTVLLDTQKTTEVYRARGWDNFVIRVELSGTKGAPNDQGTPYQNAQLFRQALRPPVPRVDPEWYNPLHVVVEMADADSAL